MKGILIRIKPGFQMQGEGEKLGQDNEGVNHIFWKASGQMEVPFDMALKLIKEKPQRFELVDKSIMDDILSIPEEEKSLPVETKNVISKKELNAMTKDQINDWAAKRDYDVNTKDKKSLMLSKLFKQIFTRTGQKVV